jgi:hypothetical protein
MKQILILVIFFALAVTASAQNKTANSLTYKTAVGVRIWNGGALNLKTFLTDKTALEFIGFLGTYGTRITGLYEFHGDLNTEGNLKWYLGFGGHASLYKSGKGGGIDGVAGIEYKFENLPLNLALDWQPSIEAGVGPLNGFQGSYGGLAIRFTL